MITKKQKIIFKLWVLDEIIEDRLDKEIAGNMITDESFKVGIENWLDVYSFFTPEQRDFIKKFTRGI